jgi:hypothetical protein
MEAQESSKKEVLEYLEMLKSCCQHNLTVVAHKERWHYAGMGDFLLQHAQWFEPPKAMPVWRGPIKQCFHNARMASKRYGWQYVEGIANFIIPVHHAWCVDKQGNVKEVTWEKAGNLYFGVVFTKTPKDVVFDNMYDFSMFKEPFNDRTKD